MSDHKDEELSVQDRMAVLRAHCCARAVSVLVDVLGISEEDAERLYTALKT